MNPLFYLPVICTILYIIMGTIRFFMYICIGRLSDILFGIASLICAVLWGLTAYWNLV